jgi:hypothetical protein
VWMTILEPFDSKRYLRISVSMSRCVTGSFVLRLPLMHIWSFLSIMVKLDSIDRAIKFSRT